MSVRISRRWTLLAHRLLDDWLPPVLRDNRWLMRLLMLPVLAPHVRDYMTFKNHVFGYTQEEFADLYRRVSGGPVRETDLNPPCVESIVRDARHRNVLEVGAGRGYLANLLAKDHDVTACDIVLPPAEGRNPDVTWIQANIEHLPFPDHSFDTVICTHTLEHVQDLPRSIAELRRVARKQLIIVVPRQRPYRYHFDLHTHFFPYEWSLQGAFGYRPNAVIRNLQDWYYVETIDP